MAPDKKRNRKAFADTVRHRLKKLADSVQEIRSELPREARDSVNVLPAATPVQKPGKGGGNLLIWGGGILLGILLFYIFFRNWKNRR